MRPQARLAQQLSTARTTRVATRPPAGDAHAMTFRLRPRADRFRALVAAILVVLAALLASGVPSAAADPGGAAGLDGGTDPVGQWPLHPQPEVVRAFDPPSCTWCAGHRGVDLLGSVGEPVYAALPGRVSYAGVLAGRGAVVVDHGSTRTTYEPVVATVHVGAMIAAGARLGTLEIVQSHCFPRACLHWGWIRNADDVYLDPLQLVGGPRPVRLLPLWRATPLGRLTLPLWAAARVGAQARGCACW